MRRRKKSSGLVKVLTTAAVVTAITAGTVQVYAAQGLEWFEIGNDANRVRIRIADLVENPEYRQAILDAFNGAELPMFLGNDEEGVLFEQSLSATASEGILTELTGDDNPYLPYGW